MLQSNKKMDSKHIYNLGFQALPPLNNLQSPNSQHGVPTSVHAFPVLAIAVLSILATGFLLVTYYVFVNKCCSNWHRSCSLRWFSAGQSQQEEESFIALSPTMWNRGLDESVIREIPIFQYRKMESEEHRSVFGCIVCFNDFQDQDMLRLLPNCSHAFHLDCIDIWLQTNANCPLCRTSVSGTVRYPLNCIVAPSSSPQGSQAFSESFMGSDEDFVVIELGNGNETIQQRQQQERNGTREVPIELRRQSTRKLSENFGKMKQRKQYHVSNSIMGDEYIDIRDRDDSFSFQPLRRSFSLDSANDQQLFLTVRDIIQQNDDRVVELGFNRFTKSFFQYGIGQRSRNCILPLESAM